mmetsp:Transcript_110990/g.264810  ORF Transcript_110990/g.264810 Transcript_110990/m.264810 type:complete len:246 (-) Transcript_110990:2093-2830(-)
MYAMVFQAVHQDVEGHDGLPLRRLLGIQRQLLDPKLRGVQLLLAVLLQSHLDGRPVAEVIARAVHVICSLGLVILPLLLNLLPVHPHGGGFAILRVSVEEDLVHRASQVLDLPQPAFAIIRTTHGRVLGDLQPRGRRRRLGIDRLPKVLVANHQKLAGQRRHLDLHAIPALASPPGSSGVRLHLHEIPAAPGAAKVVLAWLYGTGLRQLLPGELFVFLPPEGDQVLVPGHAHLVLRHIHMCPTVQ